MLELGQTRRDARHTPACEDFVQARMRRGYVPSKRSPEAPDVMEQRHRAVDLAIVRARALLEQALRPR